MDVGPFYKINLIEGCLDYCSSNHNSGIFRCISLQEGCGLSKGSIGRSPELLEVAQDP